MARSPQTVGQATQSLGARPGLKFYSPAPFRGINLEDAPPSIEDAEFTYLQNFLPLGSGNLRTAWDAGNAIYTCPSNTTIIAFFSFNIGGTGYFAIFLSDGSAVQYDEQTTAVVQIGPPGTFYNSSGNIPACAQYGTEFLLISNNNTVNDYWAWDGALLYTAGTAAVQGATLTGSGNNYTGATPTTVTPFGGQGTGLQVQPVIEGGQVVNLNITNPGSGYQINDVVQLAFSGGGSDTGAQMVATLNTTNGGGGVAGVIITIPGSGYTSAPTVTIAPPTGLGGQRATATATIGSSIASITVTAGGSNYQTPVVTITPAVGDPGAGANAVAVVIGGVITGITVVDGGFGYGVAPTITITDTTPSAGAGATAIATINTGQVTNIVITNPGSGYTAAPVVAISAPGGSGIAATGQAVLSPTSISGVTVINPGSGYLYPPTITFVGGGGTGAEGIVQLNPTTIAQINVIDPGSNYTKSPQVLLVYYDNTAGVTNTPFTPQVVSGVTATAQIQGGQVVAINVSGGGTVTGPVEVLILPAGTILPGTGLANLKTQVQPDTGKGATAQAILTPTSIASVTMTNRGRGYTSAPAVVIGAGANNAATALVTLMPYGVSGSCMETFSGRVWIANPAQSPYTTLPSGGNFQASAAGSITDFATSDGGVQFTSTDSFLQTQYVGIKQSNGYLYFFGDSSVSVVTGVSTSGTPPTTTFSYQNVDPDNGLSWRDSLVSFSRSILFGNNTGVYGLYGGSATNISQKLRNLFANAIYPPTAGAVYPTSALVTLFNQRYFLMLLTIQDPDTGQPSNVMVTWNENEWLITTQSVNLTRITAQHMGSNYTAYGTDGQKIYPLFQQPSSTLVKRLDTKYYGNNQPFMIKDWTGLYVSAQDASTNQAGINITTAAVISGLSQQSTYDPSAPDQTVTDTLIMNQTINIQSPYPYWAAWATGTGGMPFINMGLRLTSSSPDFVLNHLVISYTDDRFIGA